MHASPACSLQSESWIIENLARNRLGRALSDGMRVSHAGVPRDLTRLGDGRSPTRIARAVQPWLHDYNTQRPHSALNGKPPLNRINRDNVLGNDRSGRMKKSSPSAALANSRRRFATSSASLAERP
jgi:hypothetical protein